jgi:hypothetical protein
MYGLPKQASLHRNSLKNNSRKQATHRANSHQATGSTNGTSSVSPLLWMTLGVKYIGKEHIMHLIRVLKEHYEAEEDWEGKSNSCESPLTGTTSTTKYTYPCPSMWNAHKPNSAIQYRKSPNTSHINTPFPRMGSLSLRSHIRDHLFNELHARSITSPTFCLLTTFDSWKCN